MASQTPSHQDQDLTIKNAVLEVPDKMPKRVYPYENMDITGYVESFNKYEADYTRWLKAKYFSDKDIYGGDIFEEKITPNGFTIKASRWSGMKSYANPASFADQSSVGRSAPAAETPADVSKERQLTKKNG